MHMGLAPHSQHGVYLGEVLAAALREAQCAREVAHVARSGRVRTLDHECVSVGALEGLDERVRLRAALLLLLLARCRLLALRKRGAVLLQARNKVMVAVLLVIPPQVHVLGVLLRQCGQRQHAAAGAQPEPQPCRGRRVDHVLSESVAEVGEVGEVGEWSEVGVVPCCCTDGELW
jgi:hypothetical protein